MRRRSVGRPRRSRIAGAASGFAQTRTGQDKDMVAETEGTRHWTRWDARQSQPGWIGIVGNLAVLLAAGGAGLGSLYFAQIVSGPGVELTAAAILALAAVAGAVAGAARWMHAALAARVDILSQALEASPDAQLILTADGRIAYANNAFHDLFPQSGNAPLARIAGSLADPESAADFDRLRSRAAAGVRAIAALPLRNARGAAAGWFNVSVNPIAGRPGYSFWNVQDITARHEMEAVIRDERNKLLDFLDDAPIGFYSVEASGRFLFVNQTLAKWLGSSAEEIVGSAARLHDFLALPAPADTAAFDPFGGDGDGEQRGEVVLKSHDGRRVHSWIGQSIVGSGAELRTRSVVRDLTPEREWEAALRLSRERFQRFFASAPVGIALIDRFGRLEEANAALGELFGTPQQELIGQPLIEFVNEDDSRCTAA
jgi:two-component system cell cycle sensor histidine kinase/response regulator CckA